MYANGHILYMHIVHMYCGGQFNALQAWIRLDANGQKTNLGTWQLLIPFISLIVAGDQFS